MTDTNPFNWSLPRIQILAQNTSGASIDLSSRLISFSATLVDSYSVDLFTVKLSNSDQYLTTNFSYGKSLDIYATFNQLTQEKIIEGRLEDPEPSYTKQEGATMTFSGKDWTAELQNPIVLELYKSGSFTPSTDPYVGEIIRDLVAKYAPGIDATGVPDTATQIGYKLFTRDPLFDCIKFLADLIDYRFYVNADKELIFEPIPTATIVLDSFTGLSGNPSGWTEYSGTWDLAGNHYLQSDNTGTQVTYRTSENFEDVVLDFYVTITEGNTAGAVVRLNTSTGDHYYVAIDVANNLIGLYRIDNWTGTKTELVTYTPSTPIAYNIEYQLRIFAKTVDTTDVLFTVFFDDLVNCAIYWQETAYVTSGKVGLRAEDSIASFDEFTAANAYLIIEEAFNATSIKLKTQLSRQKNRVYVAGGYEKFPHQEVVTPSGSTDIITLTYLPSEVRVLVTGDATPKKGGIFGIDDADTSVYYLVEYFAKKLHRRGGNWSATSTTIDYNRNSPLIGKKEDPSTFVSNGYRDYIHTDKTLNTQTLVDTKAQALLDRLKTVIRTGSSTVVGILWLMKPGDYVLVKSPSNGLSSYTMMKANSIKIDFDKTDGLRYSFELDNEDVTLALLLNSYELRLKRLERRDVAEALTRLEDYSETATIQDAIVGESNGVGFKYGHIDKYGHNKKFGTTGAGYTVVF